MLKQSCQVINTISYFYKVRKMSSSRSGGEPEAPM